MSLCLQPAVCPAACPVPYVSLSPYQIAPSATRVPEAQLAYAQLAYAQLKTNQLLPSGRQK